MPFGTDGDFEHSLPGIDEIPPHVAARLVCGAIGSHVIELFRGRGCHDMR